MLLRKKVKFAGDSMRFVENIKRIHMRESKFNDLNEKRNIFVGLSVIQCECCISYNQHIECGCVVAGSTRRFLLNFLYFKWMLAKLISIEKKTKEVYLIHISRSKIMKNNKLYQFNIAVIGFMHPHIQNIAKKKDSY